MKKLVALILAVMVVNGLVASSALAKKPKKPKVAPVATTMWAHGPSQFGELDGIQWVANTFPTTSPLTFDGVEPTGGTAKSQSFAMPAINSQCTGTPIANPVFQGNVTGRITGDVKVIAHFLSAPGTITARLWVDTAIFQCNDAYVAPTSEVEVTLPSGQGESEIVFPGLDITATSLITVQILAEDVANGYQGQLGRLLYDSTDAPTRVEFSCIPASGASCLPS
ncbi:MAG TPA: hypothetical protein VNC78_07200 [Actinomycetota bacterium]|nr:hypothetical protein [Actinomycetota bacterium]